MKKFLATILAISFLFTMPNVLAIDGTLSPWAEKEVTAAIEAKIVPDEVIGRYTENITREDFCRLIVRMVLISSGTKSDDINDTLLWELVHLLGDEGFGVDTDPFTDTQNPYIIYAYTLGIVNGKGDNLFDPNGSIKREEAATMLFRTAIIFTTTLPNSEMIEFKDSTEFSTWAADAISFISSCVNLETNQAVMGGTGDGMFSPKAFYTREQAILTVYRLFNLL